MNDFKISERTICGCMEEVTAHLICITKTDLRICGARVCTNGGCRVYITQKEKKKLNRFTQSTLHRLRLIEHLESPFRRFHSCHTFHGMCCWSLRTDSMEYRIPSLSHHYRHRSGRRRGWFGGGGRCRAQSGLKRSREVWLGSFVPSRSRRKLIVEHNLQPNELGEDRRDRLTSCLIQNDDSRVFD